MLLKIFRKKLITNSILNHLKPKQISINQDLHRYHTHNLEIGKLEEKRQTRPAGQ